MDIWTNTWYLYYLCPKYCLSYHFFRPVNFSTFETQFFSLILRLKWWNINYHWVKKVSNIQNKLHPSSKIDKLQPTLHLTPQILQLLLHLLLPLLLLPNLVLQLLIFLPLLLSPQYTHLRLLISRLFIFILWNLWPDCLVETRGLGSPMHLSGFPGNLHSTPL